MRTLVLFALFSVVVCSDNAWNRTTEKENGMLSGSCGPPFYTNTTHFPEWLYHVKLKFTNKMKNGTKSTSSEFVGVQLTNRHIVIHVQQFFSRYPVCTAGNQTALQYDVDSYIKTQLQPKASILMKRGHRDKKTNVSAYLEPLRMRLNASCDYASGTLDGIVLIEMKPGNEFKTTPICVPRGSLDSKEYQFGKGMPIMFNSKFPSKKENRTDYKYVKFERSPKKCEEGDDWLLTKDFRKEYDAIVNRVEGKSYLVGFRPSNRSVNGSYQARQTVAAHRHFICEYTGLCGKPEPPCNLPTTTTMATTIAATTDRYMALFGGKLPFEYDTEDYIDWPEDTKATEGRGRWITLLVALSVWTHLIGK